jgi:hypothetical protein
MTSSRRQAIPEADAWILRDVDRALGDAGRMLAWWREKEAARSFSRRFEVVKFLAAGDRAEGFFDEAEVSFGKIPVMGLTQDLQFDRPKTGSTEFYRAQIREFALNYLLRVADYASPAPGPGFGFGPLAERLLRVFQWGPASKPPDHGFGYSQICYREKASGEVGAFPEAEQAAVTDLREVGPKYEWIVLRARPYDYNLEVKPGGSSGPRLVIPLPDSPTLALNRELIINQDNPEPGILGRYGFAYALLHDPTPRGAQVYGPAQFRAGFQMIEFTVRETGEIRVRLGFTADRPNRIFAVPLDPIGFTLSLAGLLPVDSLRGALAPLRDIADRLPRAPSLDPLVGSIRLANLVTGGLAARSLNFSLEQLERDILAAHFGVYYGLIKGALLTYRKVPDWLDRDNLPEWARTGVPASV